MPIHKVKLPDGSVGYKWGQTGKVYKDKKDALKQMQAIYASGWRLHSKKAALTPDIYKNILYPVSYADTYYNNGYIKQQRRPGGIYYGLPISMTGDPNTISPLYADWLRRSTDPAAVQDFNTIRQGAPVWNPLMLNHSLALAKYQLQLRNYNLALQRGTLWDYDRFDNNWRMQLSQHGIPYSAVQPGDYVSIPGQEHLSQAPSMRRQQLQAARQKLLQQRLQRVQQLHQQKMLLEQKKRRALRLAQDLAQGKSIAQLSDRIKNNNSTIRDTLANNAQLTALQKLLLHISGTPTLPAYQDTSVPRTAGHMDRMGAYDDPSVVQPYIDQLQQTKLNIQQNNAIILDARKDTDSASAEAIKNINPGSLYYTKDQDLQNIRNAAASNDSPQAQQLKQHVDTQLNARKLRNLFKQGIADNGIAKGTDVAATKAAKPWLAQYLMRKRHFSNGTAYYTKTQTQSAAQARKAYADTLRNHIRQYNTNNKNNGVFYDKGSINRFLKDYKGDYTNLDQMMQAYQDWGKNDKQYQQNSAYARQVMGNRGRNLVRLTQNTNGTYRSTQQSTPTQSTQSASGTTGTQTPTGRTSKAPSARAKNVGSFHYVNPSKFNNRRRYR